MRGKLIEVHFDTLNLELDKTTFFPGGTWLYLNLYSNQNCIDSLIVDITSVIRESNGKSPYFFTRYADEKGDHLRFRTQVCDYRKILGDLNTYFNRSSYVLNVNIGTYHREVTRYGWPTVIDAERLFHIDSKIVSIFLVKESQTSDIDRIAFCMFNLDHYLDCFALSDADKLSFVKTAKEDFFNEFDVDGRTKKSMNRLYQKHLKGKSSEIVCHVWGNYKELLIEREEICSQLINTYSFGKRYNSFIWSVLHMFVNKIFSKQYRLYEMIGYDYLEKYLKDHMYGKKTD